MMMSVCMSLMSPSRLDPWLMLYHPLTTLCCLTHLPQPKRPLNTLQKFPHSGSSVKPAIDTSIPDDDHRESRSLGPQAQHGFDQLRFPPLHHRHARPLSIIQPHLGTSDDLNPSQVLQGIQDRAVEMRLPLVMPDESVHVDADVPDQRFLMRQPGLKDQRHGFAAVEAEMICGPEDREGLGVELPARRQEFEMQAFCRAAGLPINRMGGPISCSTAVAYHARWAGPISSMGLGDIGEDVIVAEYVAVDLDTELGG